MNKDKIGELFHYPDTFYLLLGHVKVISFAIYKYGRRYCTRGHARVKVVPSIPDYTTINIEE